jgi:hypothetical protein
VRIAGLRRGDDRDHRDRDGGREGQGRVGEPYGCVPGTATLPLSSGQRRDSAAGAGLGARPAAAAKDEYGAHHRRSYRVAPRYRRWFPHAGTAAAGKPEDRSGFSGPGRAAAGSPPSRRPRLRTR